jgi:chaperonin GroEL
MFRNLLIINVDAQTGEFKDLVQAGTMRTALLDSASGLLVTTEATVAERPEKKSAGGGMPPDGDRMGGMDF